jgi:methyl coenzyme M reductase subunit C-like uncharacterized protein (methanogenesis marker protein 7)
MDRVDLDLPSSSPTVEYLSQQLQSSSPCGDGGGLEYDMNSLLSDVSYVSGINRVVEQFRTNGAGVEQLRSVVEATRRLIGDGRLGGQTAKAVG